jgi:DNA polymerase III epsilon subunit family exonuclease
VSPKIACLDLETTGLRPSTDRVLEIALVVLDPDGGLAETFSTLVNPGCDPGPTFAHGITTEMLVGAPAFEDVAQDLAHRIKGTVLVAHNVNFDYNFLRCEFERAGLDMPDTPTLCTIRAAWALGRRQHGGSRKLADLCAAEGIIYDNAHTALGDAQAVATLTKAYLSYAHQLGLTLEDLLD